MTSPPAKSFFNGDDGDVLQKAPRCVDPAASGPKPEETEEEELRGCKQSRITLDFLEEHYDIPLMDLAKKLDLSITMLKKVCRKFGIQRWPHRQIRSIDKALLQLEEKRTALQGSEDRGCMGEIVRQIEALEKKRRLVTQGASSGLESTLRNAIFMANPEELEEGNLTNQKNLQKLQHVVSPCLYDKDHAGRAKGSVPRDVRPKELRVKTRRPTPISTNGGKRARTAPPTKSPAPRSAPCVWLAGESPQLGRSLGREASFSSQRSPKLAAVSSETFFSAVTEEPLSRSGLKRGYDSFQGIGIVTRLDGASDADIACPPLYETNQSSTTSASTSSSCISGVLNPHRWQGGGGGGGGGGGRGGAARGGGLLAAPGDGSGCSSEDDEEGAGEPLTNISLEDTADLHKLFAPGGAACLLTPPGLRVSSGGGGDGEAAYDHDSHHRDQSARSGPGSPLFLIDAHGGLLGARTDLYQPPRLDLGGGGGSTGKLWDHHHHHHGHHGSSSDSVLVGTLSCPGLKSEESLAPSCGSPVRPRAADPLPTPVVDPLPPASLPEADASGRVPTGPPPPPHHRPGGDPGGGTLPPAGDAESSPLDPPNCGGPGGYDLHRLRPAGGPGPGEKRPRKRSTVFPFFGAEDPRTCSP